MTSNGKYIFTGGPLGIMRKYTDYGSTYIN